MWLILFTKVAASIELRYLQGKGISPGTAAMYLRYESPKQSMSFFSSNLEPITK